MRQMISEPMSPALGASSMGAAFLATVAEYGDQVAFTATEDQPAQTWSQYGDKVRQVAAGLVGLGLRRGDTVALMLNTRPEFFWFDTAVASIGATSVSIYNTNPAEAIEHVLEMSGARLVITESIYESVLAPFVANGLLDRMIVVDRSAGTPMALSWDDVAAAGGPGFDLESHVERVEPDDVLVLSMTSGSTGDPKAVELTHHSVLFLCQGLAQRLGVPVGAHQLSFLPMAHMMARTFDHYLGIALAFQVSVAPSPAEVLTMLPQVRPSVFVSTPRFWEKLKVRIEQEIAAEPDGQRRASALAALDRNLVTVRERQRTLAEGSQGLPGPTESELVPLRSYVAAVGLDRLRGALTGGAPSDFDLLTFFHALGVPLGEAYGLTECGTGATMNPPDRVRCGTTGPPFDGVQIRLAEDGEILIKGPGVMKSYRGEPDATAAAFDAEGWLKSGDIGKVDSDGYFTIVDRKKDIIINTAGKNMSPVYIESRIKQASPLVGDVVVIGDGRLYNVALVTVGIDELQRFARREGFDDLAVEDQIAHPKVGEAVAQAIQEGNARLARAEQIKKHALIREIWQPGGEELTGTMKLRRHAVAEKYADLIEDLYQSL